jgi:hypothetical protein
MPEALSAKLVASIEGIYQMWLLTSYLLMRPIEAFEESKKMILQDGQLSNQRN